MPELEELVKIEITKPLPETGNVGGTYKIEGSVKMFDAIGAPPWVYAEVRRKEWYLPEIVEEVSYERGFPIPITGNFSIDFRPTKDGNYEVTIVATPAPLSLPVIGVQPVVGKSDMMKVDVAKPVATDIKNIEISVIGPAFPATDLKNITIGIIGPEFPTTDLKNIAIIVRGPAYPATDLKNITIKPIGIAFPSTDLKNIEISVVPVAPPEEYTLEVTVEPPATGYVTKSPSKARYSAGEVVTLTAHPYSGYEFDHWGGWPPYPGVGSTSPTIQITMDANWWVVAAFRKVAVAQCPLSVSASPSSGGSVTVSPDKALYDDGEMIDVTAFANPGWSFDKFTGVRPDGSTWESHANPVHPRGCRTTSVTAHFIF